MGGIRSTGISSCLALAEEVTLGLAEHTAPTGPLADPVIVPMPNLAEARLRPYADADLIARDPAYGRVVCLCERVTGGEIRDALASPVPATRHRRHPAAHAGARRQVRGIPLRSDGDGDAGRGRSAMPDVVIVGAGPAGLTLARDLRTQGVRRSSSSIATTSPAASRGTPTIPATACATSIGP